MVSEVATNSVQEGAASKHRIETVMHSGNAEIVPSMENFPFSSSLVENEDSSDRAGVGW